MSKGIGFLVFILGVALVFSLSFGLWMFFDAKSEIQEHVEREIDLELEIQGLENRLDVLTKERENLQKRVLAINQALQDLDGKNTTLKNRYKISEDKKLKIEQKNKDLQVKVDALNKTNIDLEQKFKELQSQEYLAAILRDKAALEVELGNLRGQLQEKENQIQEMKISRRPSEEKMQNLAAEKEKLEELIEKSQAMTDILSRDLIAEKRKAQELNFKVSQLELKLQKASKEEEVLLQKVSYLTEEVKQKDIALKETRRVAQSQKISAGVESIELPPIIVKAPQQEQETSRETITASAPTLRRRFVKQPEVVRHLPDIQGRIVTINAKYKFVVIDIGENDGLVNGMALGVYRAGELIGNLKVIEVRERIAAADILDTSAEKSIMVKDYVRPLE